jgi:NAD(P)-dependent dehydrogenase (short-subunit alcohol dehydrogenase family)
VRLAEEGARIVGVDLCGGIATVGYPMPSMQDLQETVRLVEKTGSRMLARQADVRDQQTLRAAVADGLEEFGQLDIVVGMPASSAPRRRRPCPNRCGGT